MTSIQLSPINITSITQKIYPKIKIIAIAIEKCGGGWVSATSIRRVEGEVRLLTSSSTWLMTSSS